MRRMTTCENATRSITRITRGSHKKRYEDDTRRYTRIIQEAIRGSNETLHEDYSRRYMRITREAIRGSHENRYEDHTRSDTKNETTNGTMSDI